MADVEPFPLVVDNARKRFGPVVALDGFDLTVGAGEIVGLVGHNGAGKTTFARAVAGLVALDGGRIRVDGIDGAREPRRARAAVGWAPQELALYPTCTARENLLFFAGLNGMRHSAARRRAIELGAALALDDVLDRPVRELSGGQQRRVQAATAMMHRPAVLLLDEPTVGADPVTREAVLTAVRAMANEGCAVVYATHYLPELDVLGASLAVVKAGRVIARGTRRELLATTPGRAVLRYAGTPPILSSGVSGAAAIEVDASDVTIIASDPAMCVAGLLARHAGDVARLRAIELSPPTLDDLYRQLLHSSESRRDG
jgi:ABC-2 type transport system ATP-binding protein